MSLMLIGTCLGQHLDYHHSLKCDFTWFYLYLHGSMIYPIASKYTTVDYMLLFGVGVHALRYLKPW